MTIKLDEKSLAVLVLVVVVGLAIWKAGDGSGSSDPRPPRNPLDFVYIDSNRIADYLSQLEGGKPGAARRVKKEIRQAKAQVSSAGLTFGSDAQNEDEIETTLVPTASSGMEVILNDLHERKKTYGVATRTPSSDGAPGLRTLDLSGKRPPDDLTDGSLVIFRTHDLVSPGYIRPYVVVRSAATLAALFPRIRRGGHVKARAHKRQHRARAFAKRVGGDPRITLDVDLPAADDADRPLRVLLPIEYKGLTRQRSMIEKEAGPFVGGSLTVVGKVIRILRNPRPGGRGRNGRPEFVDYSTRESWNGPIHYASPKLLNQIGGRDCHAVHTVRLAKSGRVVTGHMKSRHCLLAKLRRQTELSAPGVVILPLAIYK